MMDGMKFPKYRLVVPIILVFFAGAALALAGQVGQAKAGASSVPGAAVPSTALQDVQPGNYCVSCHMAEDMRLGKATGWIGGIDRAQNSPCPAVLRIQEELLYTEQLMLATDRLRGSLPDRAGLEKVDAQIAAGQQGYSRLLDSPASSLSAFTSEAQTLRFQRGKSYAALNGALEAIKKQRILAGAILVTLVIFLSFVWGLRITQTAIRAVGKAPEKRARKSAIRPAVLALVVFAFFTLPIFRVPPAEIETASAEEQAVQTALDTAGRAADAAGRSFARAWMLARVGAAWLVRDPDRADQALAEALSAAQEAGMNAQALWGQAQAAQEVSAGSGIHLEKSSLAAGRLQAERSRAWGLRLIADEWAQVDPGRAELILEEAALAAGQIDGIYHDLDLRLIAVSWARLDPDRAAALAGEVQDPALRAWGLREIAALAGGRQGYRQAVEAARQIQDPLELARTLREVAAASGDGSLFEEARAALQGAPKGPALAFALAELAGASGNLEILQDIDAQYPEARAVGFYRLGLFQEAWKAADEIPNPYSRGRAQAAITAAWGNLAAVELIDVPLYRDLALRDIAAAERDTSAAEKIASPYYRVQALTASGAYEAAWEAAGALQEPFPLVALATAAAESSPDAALEMVEHLGREVDKAEALRAIAAVTGDEQVFQRALRMALAARKRGDPLAPSQASLALALDFIGLNESWSQAAFVQAFEAAERISVK